MSMTPEVKRMPVAAWYSMPDEESKAVSRVGWRRRRDSYQSVAPTLGPHKLLSRKLLEHKNSTC